MTERASISRSSVFLFFAGLSALFSLLYLSSVVGDHLPLVSHLKPKVTKEQATDIAESFLKSQVANITRIRTEQQVESMAPHREDPISPIFLGFYDDRNGTIFYRLNSTDYTMVGKCYRCFGENKEFRDALKGHLFYAIELYYDTGMGNGFASISVDAINGDIIYPKEIHDFRPPQNTTK